MLFAKLVGVFVGVIALMMFVALLSVQGVPPGVESGTEEADQRPVMRTQTSTTTRADRTVVSLVTSNPTKASSTISTPGPLIVPKDTPPPPMGTAPSPTPSVSPSITPATPVNTAPKAGALNQQDIILLTNSERIKAGLSPLAFNATLSLIAEAKAKDMIARQYFAHMSPSGIDVSGLAVEYGYQYKNIGENLALGDFENSKDVVDGWMNSPGHRANILNTDFTQIGVAAIVGSYNGHLVWYSVQEFGRPLPKCTMPDSALEQKIDLYQSEIETTEATLLRLKSEIESPNIDEETYRAKVKDYNIIVKSYNDLVEAVKSAIAAYNAQVSAYNTCVNNG